MTPEEKLYRIAKLQRRFINFDTDIKRLWKRIPLFPQGYPGMPAGAFDGQFPDPPGCDSIPACTVSGCDGCVAIHFGGVDWDVCMTQFSSGAFEGLSSGELVRYGGFSHGGESYTVRLQNPNFYWVENTDGSLRGCYTTVADGCVKPWLPEAASVSHNTGYTLQVFRDSGPAYRDIVAIFELDAGASDPITSNVPLCFDLIKQSTTITPGVISSGAVYHDGL